jgi:hypothetical protein
MLWSVLSDARRKSFAQPPRSKVKTLDTDTTGDHQPRSEVRPGDIELVVKVDFLIDSVGTVDIIIDLRITHDRWGSH